MKATIITSTLAALSLAGLLAGPAFAQTASSSAAPATSSPASSLRDRGDCPDGFDAGDAAGIRLCHGPEGWRLVTTDPAKSGAHEYTGTLTTNGKFTDVYLVRPENDDSATVDGNGNLDFDFKTYSGIDGVDFRVDGGRTITFNLLVDGQPIPVQHIWIGDRGRHPENDPFTLPAHRRHHANPGTAPAPAN